MKHTKRRTIWVSDDIWDELYRLRSDRMYGEQMTWDDILNILLIVWHGNGDWRSKVKAVDVEARKRLDTWAKTRSHIDLEELEKKYKELKNELHDKFSDEQNFKLNTKEGARKYGIKRKWAQIKDGDKHVGNVWYCGKCDSEIETNSLTAEPPCNCEV